MKIHVWAINYSPEVTGIAPYNASLCEFLARRGHDVRMVTSFCYYPAWQKLPGEGHLAFRSDHIDGITVHRCWHYVPRHATTGKRIVHELSFVCTSFLRQLFLPRPDLMIAISPPLLLGSAAWLLGKIKRTRFFFHVQDLQPDAAEGLGMLKEGSLFLKILKRLAGFAYAKAARVSAITPGMLQTIHEKGVAKTKLVLFPNGVELPDFWRLPQKNQFRKVHGISEKEFLVVYSGNLGRKQGLNQILDAAHLVTCKQIRFIICGDGTERTELERKASDLQLTNVLFLPLLPEPRYRELLIDANLCVIPQQPRSGSCFFPSKLLKTLAFSAPVLAITEHGSELERAITDGEFGISIPPGEPEKIAAELDHLSTRVDELQEWGRSGFKFVKRFDLGEVLAKYCQEIEAI